jgi:hypothetical protein
MVTLDDDRSAALLIRVWIEDGTDGFRARLTSLGTPGDDATGEEMTVAVAASPGDVLAAVRHWLEGFGRRAAHHADRDQ